MKWIFLTGLFFLSNWLMDLGQNTLNDFLENGFWRISGVQVYHLAWYFSIVVFLIVVFLGMNFEKKFNGDGEE